MTRILGIDPGSRITGYGIVEVDGGRLRYLDSGCVHAQGDAFPERLRIIFDGLCQVVETYRPDEMAVEQVFMHRNADSALKLGQARGAAICAGLSRAIPVSEYTPRAIKLAVVGRGGAAKQQVQHMMQILLGLEQTPTTDAADALAVAVCHGHTRQGLAKLVLRGAGR